MDPVSGELSTDRAKTVGSRAVAGLGGLVEALVHQPTRAARADVICGVLHEVSAAVGSLYPEDEWPMEPASLSRVLYAAEDHRRRMAETGDEPATGAQHEPE